MAFTKFYGSKFKVFIVFKGLRIFLGVQKKKKKKLSLVVLYEFIYIFHSKKLFFFYLEIEIYTIHIHTLFEEGRGDSNLCQMGGDNFLAPLGQIPSGPKSF